mgnify:CR=1 FL=1
MLLDSTSRPSPNGMKRADGSACTLPHGHSTAFGGVARAIARIVNTRRDSLHTREQHPAFVINARRALPLRMWRTTRGNGRALLTTTTHAVRQCHTAGSRLR